MMGGDLHWFSNLSEDIEDRDREMKAAGARYIYIMWLKAKEGADAAVNTVMQRDMNSDGSDGSSGLF